MVTGIVLLLALFLALVVLIQQQAFFGQAITILLCVCIGILVVFVIYLIFSQISEIARENRQDESKLSERHIEKILETGSRGKAKMQLDEEERAAMEEAAYRKEELRREEERLLAVRRQEEYDAVLRDREERERAQWEAGLEQPVQSLQAKAGRIREAEEDAYRRANEIMDERERRFAQAEYEALRRAREEAEEQLAAEGSAVAQARREADEAEFARQSAQEERRTQAMESVRKQAEAMELARRRAAQAAAATTQGTPPAARSASMPAFQVTQPMPPAAYGQVPPQPVDTTASYGYAAPSGPAAAPPYLAPVFQQPAPQQAYPPVPATAGEGDTIWEKMQVRQSAAPVMGQGPGPGFATARLPSANATSPYSNTALPVRPPQPPQGGQAAPQPPQTGAFLPTGQNTGGTAVPPRPPLRPGLGAGGVASTAQQMAAAREMGGNRPLLDTTRFSTGALASFQAMNITPGQEQPLPAYTEEEDY